MTRGNSESQVHKLEELVQRTQKGDVASFAGVYERFFDPIYRYILFRVSNHSEAEDLTEEVFVKALRSINSFRQKGHPFSSWMFRIAHNLVVDHYRKKSREKWVPLDMTMETPSLDLELKLSLEQIKTAMGNLTKAQSEVISLRFAGELSVRETARAMSKSENAVKALQHAALVKLRRALHVDVEHKPLKGNKPEMSDETAL